MFARVQTIHQSADKLDELSRIAAQQLPGAQGLPGFNGFYYLVDRSAGKALVVSLWHSEENLRQLEAKSSVREQVEAETGMKSPTAEIFEVALATS